MKKLTLVFGIILVGLFTSCSPEEQDCNCGLITSDRVEDYSIVVRSECTGNTKRFTLSQGDWFNAHVGTDFCITNSTGW
tara:strand:- start:1574 stop:1810 length:237 start_codon:yes stop_codon:yes gene_type:complete